MSPLPAGVSVDNLKATLSNNTSGVIMLRYRYRAFTFYGGFEVIQFADPSDQYSQGFTTLGGYTVLPGAAKTTEYDINKILRVFWISAKYAVRDDLDVAGAIYHYNQNNYNSGTSPCTNGGLSASSCAGTLDAASAMIDYRVTKRLEMYAGVMWSRVRGAWRAGISNSKPLAPLSAFAFSFRTSAKPPAPGTDKAQFRCAARMFVRGPQPGLDLLATIVLSPPMKIVEPSDLADPDAAARKLVESRR